MSLVSKARRGAAVVQAVVTTVVVVLTAVAACSGWVTEFVEMPGRVQQMEERQEQIVTWVSLTYCEDRGLAPTECNPEQIPVPGQLSDMTTLPMGPWRED